MNPDERRRSAQSQDMFGKEIAEKVGKVFLPAIQTAFVLIYALRAILLYYQD